MNPARAIEAMIALNAAGFSAEEIAGLISNAQNAPRRQKREERALDMERRYRAGQTLEFIAVAYDITRERVRQILYKRGVTGKDGGDAIASMMRADAKQAQNSAYDLDKGMQIYGCHLSEARELNGTVLSREGSLARIYMYQRRDPFSRGISWEISFPEFVR